MFTSFTQIQMITCYTVKPEWHKCGLNPQMWIIGGKYYSYIYDNSTGVIRISNNSQTYSFLIGAEPQKAFNLGYFTIYSG